MIQQTFAALAQSANGKILRGAPDLAVQGHFTDTRSPVRGGLYIALRGDRFDGNAFAQQAVEQHGAAAVLIDREQALAGVPEYAGAILVEDARAAYLGIAAAHRNCLSRCIWLGVTGSVGKSTTKDLLAHILNAAWPARKIQKAQESFNNAIGVSKTILETSADNYAAVLELGTNHPGEIEQLAAAARPSIAVITRAAESHLEAFGSVKNVAIEKSRILKFQQPGDTAILNADDAYFDFWKSAARGRVISFGCNAPADVRASNIELDEFGRPRFTVEFQDSRVACALKLFGLHQVSNALAAIAAALAAKVSLKDAVSFAGTFEGVARRFAVHRVAGITLIDDAYNANPASFTAALDTLAVLPSKRKFIIAAGMLELGAQSAACHCELGAAISRLDLNGLTLVGGLAKSIGDSAMENGFPAFALNCVETPEEAAGILARVVRPGDALLIKGSHGFHLNRTVNALLNFLR